MLVTIVTVTVEYTDLYGGMYQMAKPFQSHENFIDIFNFMSAKEAKQTVERMGGYGWRKLEPGLYQAEIPVQRKAVR